MTTVTIDGHEIELEDLEKGQLTTDVIILRRVVEHDEDGELVDSILGDWTENTTGIIRAGMYRVLDYIEMTGGADA